MAEYPLLRQNSFSEDLQSPLGIPLYYPLPFITATQNAPADTVAAGVPSSNGPGEGRIGDIAFFQNSGKYKWLRNAFDVEVCVIGLYPDRRVSDDGTGLNSYPLRI